MLKFLLEGFFYILFLLFVYGILVVLYRVIFKYESENEIYNWLTRKTK